MGRADWLCDQLEDIADPSDCYESFFWGVIRKAVLDLDAVSSAEMALVEKADVWISRGANCRMAARAAGVSESRLYRLRRKIERRNSARNFFLCRDHARWGVPLGLNPWVMVKALKGLRLL